MKVFTKRPRDVLDYDVDMSEWFATIPGDDIESVEVIITSYEDEPSLVIGSAVHTGVMLMGSEPVSFKVWLSGGTETVDYIVNCIIKTEQDRTKEIEFKIKVRDK